MNKVILLKDIELKDATLLAEVHRFSDFYGKKKDLIKLLLFKKSDEFEFHIHDLYRTRWSFTYILFLFFNRSKNKYIIDKFGSKKVNLFFFLIHLFKALISVLIQLFYAFIYLFVLLILLVYPKRDFKTLNLKSIIFYRTNLVFNLTAGGSLGHILGVIKGFLHNDVSVSFIGLDKIIGIDNKIKSSILLPRKSLLLIPVFSRMETAIRSFLMVYFKNLINTNTESAIYYRITALDISPLLLKLVFRLPLIVEFNSFSDWLERSNGIRPSLKTKFISFVEGLILKNASLIICVSNELKSQLINKGYSSNKLIYCSNGVDIDKFKSLKRNNVLMNNLNIKDKKVIGFVGTFGPWHGIDLLCDTISKFNKDYSNDDVTFLLIGDGSLRKFARFNSRKFKFIFR